MARGDRLPYVSNKQHPLFFRKIERNCATLRGNSGLRGAWLVRTVWELDWLLNFLPGVAALRDRSLPQLESGFSVFAPAGKLEHEQVAFSAS